MPKKALIYEDDLVAAMILEIMLQDDGYAVIAKKNSADRLVDDVERSDPDFILLDVMLAGKILGTDAASELRKSHNTPILFMTALNDRATVDQINSLGNVSLVGKPYDRQQISSSVRKLILDHQDLL